MNLVNRSIYQIMLISIYLRYRRYIEETNPFMLNMFHNDGNNKMKLNYGKKQSNQNVINYPLIMKPIETTITLNSFSAARQLRKGILRKDIIN